MNWKTRLRSHIISIVLLSLLLTGCLGTEDQIAQELSPANQSADEIQDPVTVGISKIREQDGMTVFFVPSSDFNMGASDLDQQAGENELPVHQVHLDDYWIDETEITNRQYNICVEAGICATSKYFTNEIYNGEHYPVVGVAWQDALDYCTWTGGRLPTEAEWEYAAKGIENLIYPWGNEYDGNLLNACDENCSESWADQDLDDGYEKSAPVGSFPAGASWVGALDLAGNVWEWVEDWCGEYEEGPLDNPAGPDDGNCKIIRGGAWASPPAGLRTTYRIINTSEINPDIRHPNIGFRCVIPK